MFRYELLWWAFTLVLAALIISPVYLYLPDFPYLLPNLIFVVAAVTFTRYLFLLRLSWLNQRHVWMALVVFMAIPIIFYMGQYLNYFRTHLDNYGPDVWIENIDPATGKPLMNYLQTEYNFFGIWAIIAGVILPFRFIYQVWSDYIKKPKR